jgi:ketosteroid isomerase-like protein
MSEQIAKQWLDAVVHTANNKELEAHLDLISRDVRVTGLPGFDVIGYDDWAAQCQYEFENNVLHSVSYQGLKILEGTDNKIIFKTYETIKGTDGTVNAQGIEVLLLKEDDGKWRVIQERVLPEDEVKLDQLI